MRKPSKFGKYLLLDRIAVGGMAEVFVAKAFGVEGFERLLAIKKILPTMGEDPEFISMFVDEARIAVQLSHANIVQILELGKHDENLYIAMEYIAGRDVRQVLERFRKKGRPMPVQVACVIIAKVCEALDYAHRKLDSRQQPLGIVHRDVSPQNVLVSYDGDVKLIDFGIAKAESRLQKTQAGILKGKFSYMSPEQVRGQSIDHRSDVFAVGVVLWELLTGEKLFTGESDFAVLEKVRQGTVPLPRQLNPNIPESLQTVVMKALKAEVPERYQWASELHDDLMRFCLSGDNVYGSRQLAEWLREEFPAEAEREQERLRTWMSATVDSVELTPPARIPPPPEPSLDFRFDKDDVDPPRGRKSPSTLSDRPASVPRGNSLTPTVPELPSVKAALAALSSGEPQRQFEDSSKFRVPKDVDTLAAPPTPPQGTPKSSAPMPSIFSKPGQGLGAMDKTPAVALSLQELPTMKMDADVLAEAERALLAREAQRSRPALGDGDDEPTNREQRGTPTAQSLKDTSPEGVFAKMVAASMPPPSNEPSSGAGHNGVGFSGAGLNGAAPAGGGANGAGQGHKPTLGTSSSSPFSSTLPESRAALPAVAKVPPPPKPVDPKASILTSKIPVPISLFDEPTRTLPLQAALPEEKKARQRREAAEAQAKKVEVQAARVPRIVLGGIALGVLGLLALWFVLRPEVRATGTLVVTVRPVVPASLFLDGKSVGALPYVGRGLASGEHQLEVKAPGYKSFSRSVSLKGEARPLEVLVDLSSDAPAPMVAQDVHLGGRDEPPAKDAKAARETGAREARDAARAAAEAAVRDPAPADPQTPSAAEADARPAPAKAPEVAAEPSKGGRAPLKRDLAVRADPPPAAREVARPEPRAPEAPKPAAPAPDAAPVEPAPEVEASNSPPRLRITTDPPGATVMVDGKLIGTSPAVALGLDPTHYHAVAATLEGYAPGRRAAKLEANGTTLMHLALVARPAPDAQPAAAPQTETASTTAGPVGYLIAATSPVARVQIDGRETGRWTPVPPANPIALAAGDHTVEFVTASGQKLEEQVTIEAGKTKSLIRKLR